MDIKLSISYVSERGASRNIDVENPGWPAFEVQKEKAGKAWNYYLSKVAIDKFQDDDHDKTEQLDKWSIFYSALYRSLLHMNTASDVDGNYKGIGDHNKNVKDAPSLWIRCRPRHGRLWAQGLLHQLLGLGCVSFRRCLWLVLWLRP